MLRPAYLAGCSDELVQLYSQLENDIITDMARRMKKMGAVTDASEWQANIYREIGGLQSDIQAKLKKYDAQTQKKLQDLFNEALQKSAQNDAVVLNKANLSDSQQQILEATVKKTASSGIVTGSKKVVNDAENGYIKVFSGVQRATMTIASSAASDFVNTANQTYMQVVTGAFDYKTALKNGIDALAEKGVTTVEYTDSGKVLKRTIEGALRANIMTGINQTAQQITQDNCADLGCDLVEVDAHLGARPSHAEWQGGVYSLNGEKTIDGVTYKDFQSTCHPGEPDGICGINCRHSYYPYFPGMPRHYEQGELDEMNDKTVKYNGKEMTQYEAEQMQRATERQIRKYKRMADADEAAGVDSTDAHQKLGAWQASQRRFVDQTGLRRDYSRERIGTASNQPRSAK